LIRREWKLIAVVACLSVAWWIPQRHGPIDARSDGAIYYILGTSLAEGRGYRLLNEPGEIRAVQYPPLLPLLVAAHQKALGTSDFVVVGTWLRAFYFLLSLALAASAYRLARDYLPPPRALLAAAVSMMALHVWYLGGVLYTELPLALVAVWFAICARQTDRPRYWLATAALGVAAFSLRAAGIALLLGWVVAALLDRPRPSREAPRTLFKSAFAEAGRRAAVAVIPIIAWQGYVGSVTATAEYRHPAYPYQRSAYQYSNVTYLENIGLVNPFTPEQGRITPRGRLARFATTAAHITPSLGGAVTAQRGFWELTVRAINRQLGREVLPARTALLPMTGLGLVILAGSVVMLRRRHWLLPLCCATSAGLMCLTPWPEQFVRYFTPMVPFLAIMLIAALGAALDMTATNGVTAARRLPWIGRGLMLTVLLVILVEDAYVTWWTFRSSPRMPVTYHDGAGRPTTAHLLFYDKQAAALDEALEQIRQRARPGDVMATTMPHWAYLRTGVKAVLPPMETDRGHAQWLLDAVPARFVVLDELAYPRISQRYAAPVVEDNPGLWRRVYETGDRQARVYERVR
jgi:hypothetical protein